MATSDVKTTPGIGKNIGTYSFTEDAETKDIGRVVLNNSSGAEVAIAAVPLQVSLANTAANSTAVKVDGSAATQPVSGTVTANLGTIAGVSTAAKQPALGTAGTASADVLTVQGITSMTALKVDGSAVTQPVSGTVTVQQSTAANLKVDLSGTAANTTAIKVDGSAVTQPVSIATAPALVASSAIIGKVGIDQTTPGTTNAVSAIQNGTWTVQPGNTANSTPWLVTDTVATSGGLTISKTISAASTNATSVKASAGQVYSVQVFNTNAAARYFKLYNKASAPTVGSDTPVKVFTVPGNASGSGVVINWDKGLAFGTGIAFALTTGPTDADTGAVAANEIIVNIDYK